MIAAGMLYALALAALLGGAGLGLERLFALLRWPRRAVWAGVIAASLAVPAFVLSTSTPTPSVRAIPTPAAASANVVAQPTAVAEAAALQDEPAAHWRFSWPAWPRVDAVLLVFWALSSLALCVFMLTAVVRLHRTARRWTSTRIDGRPVWLSERTGPAVLGALRPRIVLPRWLVDAPATVRSAVLSHELSHVAARDSMLLAFAHLLLIIAPWNLPLWCQVRRLRFAIEVDCDARVLRDGADPLAYGEALLAVSVNRSRTPIGAVALTEPASHLERRIRIMTAEKPRHVLVVALALLAASASLVVCAAVVEPPPKPSLAAEFRIPPAPVPDEAQLAQQQASVVAALQRLIQVQYPQLWKGEFEGLPVITVLFAHDGTVEKSAIEMTDGVDPMIRSYSNNSLGTLGIQQLVAGYVQGELIPGLPKGKEIFVRYGERENPGHDYVYFNRPVDPLGWEARESLKLELLNRYFPDVASRRAARGQLWAIFDDGGRVLATGQDAVTLSPDGGLSSSDIEDAVVRHYPTLRSALKSAMMTGVSTGSADDVKDAAGNPACLLMLWLSPGAALPPRADVPQDS